MAGGKETPRQKLIGLMYLVLLALLALQVGAEIMNKFFELNQSMETLVVEADGKAESTLAGIKAKVAEDGRPEAEAALVAAEELNIATQKVHDHIEELKEQMTEINPDDPEGAPINMKDTDVSGRLLIGDSGKGTDAGKSLQSELDNFVKVLIATQAKVAKVLTSEKPDLYNGMNLTPDGKEHPLFKKSEDHKTANG